MRVGVIGLSIIDYRVPSALDTFILTFSTFAECKCGLTCFLSFSFFVDAGLRVGVFS